MADKKTGGYYVPELGNVPKSPVTRGEFVEVRNGRLRMAVDLLVEYLNVFLLKQAIVKGVEPYLEFDFTLDFAKRLIVREEHKIYCAVVEGDWPLVVEALHDMYRGLGVDYLVESERKKGLKFKVSLMFCEK